MERLDTAKNLNHQLTFYENELKQLKSARRKAKQEMKVVKQRIKDIKEELGING